MTVATVNCRFTTGGGRVNAGATLDSLRRASSRVV